MTRRTLVPLPGIKPMPPALEDGVLTTESMRKSQELVNNFMNFHYLDNSVRADFICSLPPSSFISFILKVSLELLIEHRPL